MAEKLLIKTQKQLTQLILSNTKWVDCFFCGCGLGKAVHIPVDSPPDCIFIPCCGICNEVILKRKGKWFLKILFRILKAVTVQGDHKYAE
jgi:hypothetical protein